MDPMLRQRTAAAFAELSRWAAQVADDDVPRDVLQRSARILIDDLAAMAGGARAGDVARVQASMARRSTQREASVFGRTRWLTGRTDAAIANAIAANWLELDEGYRPVPCHAGLYVIPALLATAEGRRSTADVLRVLAVAYEVVTRVARAFKAEPVKMQSHGRYAAIGAAAATGLCESLQGDDLHRALCAAATLITPAPRNHLALGAMVRNAWPAVGAWSGMMAVEWSQMGMGGIDGALFDVYAHVLGGTAEPDRLTDQLGRSWAVLDGYTKVYACCQHLHSLVEAMQGLAAPARERNGGRWGDIASITVDTHPLALQLQNTHPVTTLGAKFSVEHAAAATLVMGTGGPEAFDEASLANEAIGRLREIVEVRAYQPLAAPPNDRPARVRLHFKDGSSLAAECPSAVGGPDRPLGDDVVLQKADALAAPSYPNFVCATAPLLGLDQRQLGAPWSALLDAAFGGAAASPGVFADRQTGEQR